MTATNTNLSFSSILSENKDKMNQIKSLQNKPISVTPRNLLFGGVAVGSVLVVGMMATQIIAGAAALAVAGVVTIGGIYATRVMRTFDPVIRQKLMNKKIQMMIAEARKNATEQLTNQVLVNEENLDNAKKKCNEMGAAVAELRNSINPKNKGKPMYEQKVRGLERAEKAYEKVKEQIIKASAAHKDFSEKVQDYKSMEAFTEKLNGVMSYINTGNDELSSMLSIEAFGEISSNFEEALVAIENSTLFEE